ncbi:hypothetical protein ES708_14620 [subsurface metagenome]
MRAKTLKPPPGFTRKGNLLLPKHHSVADWDFEFGATKRSLSSARYVSPPTSLCILEPTGTPFFDVILCRVPGTLCLPQGEVRNWHYYHYSDSRVAMFRNQSPLGSAINDNYYEVYLISTTARLYSKSAGILTKRDETSCQTFTDQWAHYRVVFWNGYTPLAVEALCVNLYREIAGEWVQEGETMYHTGNLWKDSEINRIGFHAHSLANWPEYWDDTEIWAPE